MEPSEIPNTSIELLDCFVAAQQVAFVRVQADEELARLGQWSCDRSEQFRWAQAEYENAKMRLIVSLKPMVDEPKCGRISEADYFETLVRNQNERDAKIK